MKDLLLEIKETQNSTEIVLLNSRWILAYKSKFVFLKKGNSKLSKMPSNFWRAIKSLNHDEKVI